MCSPCAEPRAVRHERIWLALPALAFALMTVPSHLRPSRAWAQATTSADASVLRVCADPNNLPFSNAKGEGLENRLATLVAREMHRRVVYTWWAQRRGFFRNTLKANLCDVVLGVPSSLDMVLRTRPYYRSSYVFVTRRDRRLAVHTFDDAVLKRVLVGVQLVGDDGANSPPAHALARRGVIRNVRGYMVYGDYAHPNPPTRIVDAVARREVDVAVVWGPLAGWVAKHSDVPLQLTPVSPQIDLPFLPFVFDIAMGVRREDTALRDTLDAIIVRRHREIEGLLDEFGIPRVESVGSRVAARGSRVPRDASGTHATPASRDPRPDRSASEMRP